MAGRGSRNHGVLAAGVADDFDIDANAVVGDDGSLRSAVCIMFDKYNSVLRRRIIPNPRMSAAPDHQGSRR